MKEYSSYRVNFSTVLENAILWNKCTNLRKKKFCSFLWTMDCVWFSLMSGSPAALFPSSCSWHQDYHKRGTSVKPALISTQVRPINLKVAIKKHELLLFSIEIFWQKRERPFNFIASRTLKYSLRSTFCFQPLCGRQDSWNLCMLLLFTMLFSLQMCAASDPSIPLDHSNWHAPSYGPVQKGSAVQTDSFVLVMIHIQHRFVQTKDQSSVMWQSFAAVLENASE